MNRNHRHQRGGRKFFKKNNAKRPFNKDRTIACPDQLTENDVGITEYISELCGFGGILKARYSDFQLNEINLNGEIAKLTNREIPPEFKPVESNRPIPETTPDEVIPQDTWTQILRMADGGENIEVEMDVTHMDKHQRGVTHCAVKSTFKQKVVGKTLIKDDKKFIVFKKSCNTDNRSFSEPWPKGVGKYVHFLVYKENIDTLEAALKISDCLKMKPSMFTYAGIKDRRSKSTQWFCVKKAEPWKLLKKTQCLKFVHLGNICFKSEPLKLGMLQGNRFRIALRNVTADDDLINNALESLNEKGFINYYGLQRFGNNKDVPTHEIGVQLLLGNFKEACNLILKCKNGDQPDVDTTKAKKVYHETGDAVAASRCFEENKNRCVESKLLLGLAKSNKNDYVNALENLPRNMRLLYIHAFQALVWNKIVSMRIKRFGLKLMVGDLVLLKEEKNSSEEQHDEDGKIENEDEEVVNENEDEQMDVENDKEKHKKQQIKILGEEDLQNYTIFDIVLPLPGYDITYPENIKSWYKEILESYGFSLEMPKQKVKTYTLSGNYRKLFCKVTDLSWNIVNYKDPNDNLIQSDFEELLGIKKPENQPDGKYKALIVDFCLKSSCYATMVIREILKTDTSSSANSKLNNYHEAVKPKDTLVCAKPESLLSDPDKFEEFKRNVFGGLDTDSLKRKSPEETEEVEAKKSKNNGNEKSNETALKLEPALV